MESITENIWVVGGCIPTVLPQPWPLTMEQGPIPMMLAGVLPLKWVLPCFPAEKTGMLRPVSVEDSP